MVIMSINPENRSIAVSLAVCSGHAQAPKPEAAKPAPRPRALQPTLA
jgi:hypothetical protein